jgi:hypothetical protein
VRNYKKFTFGETLESAINAIPENEQLRFYKYIMNYGLHGIEPVLSDFELATWVQMRDVIDNTKHQGGAPLGNQNAKKDNNNSETTENNSETTEQPFKNKKENINIKLNLNKNINEKEREESLSGDFSKDEAFNPGKRDSVTRVDDLRKVWESCGLPLSAIITNLNVLDNLKDTLNSFSDEKISRAIKNFSTVVSQTDFDPEILPGGHIPNFKNFMIRWADRFVDEAKPLERFKTKAKGKPGARAGPDWGGSVDMGKGVKAKQFFGGNKK